MQFHSPLDSLLGQLCKVKILRFLTRFNMEFTGREVARKVGISHPESHRVLKDLANQGVVAMRRLGRAILYKVNEKNLFVREVLRPLFVLENSLLQKAMAPWIEKLNLPLISIILFGNIDILILTSSRKHSSFIKRQMDSLRRELKELFGDRISTMILTVREFGKKLKEGNRLIAEIVKRGRVIYGKSPSEVLVLKKNRV